MQANDTCMCFVVCVKCKCRAGSVAVVSSGGINITDNQYLCNNANLCCLHVHSTTLFKNV